MISCAAKRFFTATFCDCFRSRYLGTQTLSRTSFFISDTILTWLLVFILHKFTMLTRMASLTTFFQVFLA